MHAPIARVCRRMAPLVKALGVADAAWPSRRRRRRSRLCSTPAPPPPRHCAPHPDSSSSRCSSKRRLIHPAGHGPPANPPPGSVHRRVWPARLGHRAGRRGRRQLQLPEEQQLCSMRARVSVSARAAGSLKPACCTAVQPAHGQQAQLCIDGPPNDGGQLLSSDVSLPAACSSCAGQLDSILDAHSLTHTPPPACPSPGGSGGPCGLSLRCW